ncbi:proteasome accessory factor PafA2 family protein [Bifidobacterium amazonense]|uniref:Pup--protein ligase n=1 Tax=Bifidobacterium amazonense TaxID=2809027 RepID=A0ABS9VT98_9BIFI|nr:proteasome accessory factor PafA2 family protein [Bifidobacterium amazonense]MCH9275317.1 proteasome accessory factor PafA2 family protein [Bifidobacterium amazonense]
MPQLRDSGNNGPGATVERSPEFEGFARIFGVETEYGVSVTGAGRPVDAGQVAMTMFRPIVSRSRSTNTYLANGSRLYLDVGSHPEYATAEARGPLDALAQDMAGELVMRRLAAQAQEQLRGAGYGEHLRVHVFKNNADSAGHSFGCHENYLVRRYVSLEQVEHELLPFLITRQLYTGAGRVTDEGFEITQRADYLDEAVSSATTRSRPMVNTRDEPHADPEEFRRLHVIIGDSNRSQWATWMKLAVTHLVLCVIEESARLGRPSGFESFALADPGEANRAVSRDLTCRASRLRLADPSAAQAVLAADPNFDDAGGLDPSAGLTALEIQRAYLHIAERFFADHRDVMAAAMPSSDDDAPERPEHPEDPGRDGWNSLDRVFGEWRRTLDALEAGDRDAVADRVDWAAKLRLFEALHARRSGAIAQSKLAQLDMDYHDIASGTVYESLLRRGMMIRLLDDADARRALGEPPADTRAVLRGRFVAAALDAGAQFSCDWTRLTLTSPEHREAVILDPFGAAPTDDYERLMAAL